jgi:hypothetical protein
MQLQEMLRRGRCMFCGRPTAGGGIFPGAEAAIADPESHLWCRSCVSYLEQFRATPEGHIQEEIPQDPKDEAAWGEAGERIRDWFRRLEVFIRKSVSERG